MEIYKEDEISFYFIDVVELIVNYAIVVFVVVFAVVFVVVV